MLEGEKKKCIIRAVFEINLRTEFNDLCKGLRKLGLDYDILPVDKDCTYLIECNNGDVHFSKEVKD